MCSVNIFIAASQACSARDNVVALCCCCAVVVTIAIMDVADVKMLLQS